MTSDESTLWIMVIAAIFATYLWRFLGVLFSRKIDPEGAVFRWVSCVSYAMLAGLISRMIFLPAGSLETVPLWIRVAGILAGLMVFFIARKQVLAGVGAGLAVFMALVSYTA